MNNCQRPRSLSNSTKVIALDVMSGDNGPRLCIKAALMVLKRYLDLRLVLVGQREAIESALFSCHYASSCFSRLDIEHAPSVIPMGQKPSVVLRSGKDSSLWKAVSLVKQNKADACVSAGNTGAYMAIGRLLLDTFPFVDRPAIVGQLPGINRQSFMLDLGANVECSPLQLYQFAVMGSVMLSAVYGIDKPSIGLLNIGAEDSKGHRGVKEAKAYIERDASLNFSRYIEANELYTGAVDLIVCDGFIGNIALKASEGTARYIRRKLLAGRRSGVDRWLYKLAAPWLFRKASEMDPGLHNGATLLGLRGILVKSHGAAHAAHLVCAIEQAMAEVDHCVIDRIAEKQHHY